MMTDFSDFQIGQVVELADGHTATVQFVGNTHFAPGDWLGVTFDEPLGKNDGSVQGQRYFDCRAGHGMFIRPTVASILEQPTPKPNARTTGKANGAARKSIQLSSTNTALRKQRPVDSTAAKRQSINEDSPTPTARASRLSRAGESPTKAPRPTPSPSLSTPSRSNTPSTRKSILPPVSNKRTSMAPPPPPSAKAKTASRPSIASAMNGSVKPTSQSSSLSIGSASRLSLRPDARKRIGSASGESRNSTPSRHLSPPSSLGDRGTSSPKPAQEDNGGKEDLVAGLASPLSPTSELASPGSQISGMSVLSQRPRPPRGRSPVATSHRPNTEVATLRREKEDLETKLRMSEKRREEDRERLKELEKVEADRDRLAGVIQKLQAKIQPQRQEIDEIKRQKQGVENQLEALEAKQAETDSIQEMTALDKEMAEELADSMKLELQTIRQKYEELELEADILREENQELGKEISPSEKTSQGWLQLERSNERYREALMRLRDVTQEQEADLRDQVASLEQELGDSVQTKEQATSANERLADVDAVVEDLRQQLDAALSGEEMIEELAEKNLALSERMDELRSTIEDLEALKELNDELELNHSENEKQLQDEIDYNESLLADEFKKSAVQDGAIQDLEYTVSRFRDLVTTLQSDLDEMRSSQQITEAQASELTSKSRAIMDMNLKLQTSALKTQIKTIDLELGAMQASESAEHLTIVQNFLPEAFTSERDSIQALLRFRRVGLKARMLHGIIKERINDPSALGQDEDVFSYYDVLDHLTWVSATCNRFINTVETCDPETFKRLGAASYELEPVERGMNAWIDGLKQDELKAAQWATELPRYIALMAHLAELHISDSLEHFADQISLKAMMMQSHLENTAAALSRLQHIVEVKLVSSSSVPEDEERSLQTFSRIDSLVSQVRSAKVVSGKAIRQIEDLKSRFVTLDLSTWPTVEQSEQSSAELVALAVNLGFSTLKLAGSEEQAEPVSVSSEEIFAKLQAGPSSLSSIASKLQATTTHLQSFSSLTTSLTQVVEFPAPSSSPPWKQLAQQMKSANADLAARELEMSRLRDEMAEKNTALAMKDKVAEEMSVKLEVLEKRVGESGGRRERVRELEEAAASSKTREVELQNRLANAQSELQHAEAERNKWRTTAQSKTNTPLDGQRNPADGPLNTVASSEFSIRQIASLKSEIEILQSTIRYLQSESHTQNLSDSLDFLSTPLTPIPKPQPPIRKEAQNVLKEMLTLAAQPSNQIIKLEPRSAVERLRWRPAKETTMWQLQRQREDWEEWRDWKNSVAKKAAWERRQKQRVAAAALAKLEPPSAVSGRREVLATLQVQLPGKESVGGTDVQIVEPGEWEEVQQALGVKVV